MAGILPIGCTEQTSSEVSEKTREKVIAKVYAEKPNVPPGISYSQFVSMIAHSRMQMQNQGKLESKK